MEGKEVRFGIANSALWATATTAASNGSVNAMHDSFTPLGGLVPMWLIAARRGRLRRRRLGALRHAHLRDRRGLHRRPDGRAHAGVPRQEDRGLRDEDGVARHPDPGGGRSCSAPRSPAWCRRARRRSATPARTASARSSTRSRPAPTTTARPSRGLTVSGHVLRDRDRDRMFVGRYWLIVPMLAIAGSLAAQEERAGDGGHAADARAAVRRRCSSAPWCSSARSRSSRRWRSARSSSTCSSSRSDPEATCPPRPRARPLFDRADRAARARRLVPQARPAPHDPQPGDVRRRGRQRVHDAARPARARDRAGRGARRASSWPSRSGSGSRCCSPTSPRRWPRAAARRRPTRCARRAGTSSRSGCAKPRRGRAASRRSVAVSCARATSCWSRRATSIPGDGEVIEGVASVDESADHRRERAGDPRERRRPQRRHRRHARALRLARRAHHRRIPARRSSTA